MGPRACIARAMCKLPRPPPQAIREQVTQLLKGVPPMRVLGGGLESKEKVRCALRSPGGRRLRARRRGTRLHAGGRGLCGSHVAKYRSPGVRRLCQRPCQASVLRPRVNCASLPSPWGAPRDLARFRHFPGGSRLPREVLGDTCPLTVLRLPQAQLPTTSGPRIVEHIGDAGDACGLVGGWPAHSGRGLLTTSVWPALRACWPCELGRSSTCLVEPRRSRF